MVRSADSERRFSVRARDVDSHHARVVEEASFEAAAIAYVEDLASAPDRDHEVSVIVRDIDSGHEHCFRIDMDTGETAHCH
jgi:hypothetical protein